MRQAIDRNKTIEKKLPSRKGRVTLFLLGSTLLSRKTGSACRYFPHAVGQRPDVGVLLTGQGQVSPLAAFGGEAAAHLSVERHAYAGIPGFRGDAPALDGDALRLLANTSAGAGSPRGSAGRSSGSASHSGWGWPETSRLAARGSLGGTAFRLDH